MTATMEDEGERLASTTDTTAETKQRGAIIVVRHGERLDYLCRDGPLKTTGGESVNWIQKCSEEPWNPPLTIEGMKQANQLGKTLHSHIKKYNLPSTIRRIYSSPLLRCVLTSSSLIDGLNDDDNKKAILTTEKICIEQALRESSNEDWYRSWCLPNSESSWGFGKSKKWGHQQISVEDVNVDTIHPKANVPVQELFDSTERIALLHSKHNAFLQSCLKNDNVDNNNSLKEWDTNHLTKVVNLYNHDESSIKEDELAVDVSNPTQISLLDNKILAGDCCWNQFESSQNQCDRLETLCNTLARMYPNETVILVSHGGPVTHLFERLTSKPFEDFGPSKYTCCSIYIHTTTIQPESEVSKIVWEDVLVNDTSHLDDPNAGAIDYVT